MLSDATGTDTGILYLWRALSAAPAGRGEAASEQGGRSGARAKIANPGGAPGGGDKIAK